MDNNTNYIFPNWKYEKDFNLHGCFSDKIKPIHTYNEPHFHYSAIPYNGETMLDLNGFFQSYKYWEYNQYVILGLLTPRKGYGIRQNTTAIHVRRGDYLKFPDHHTNLDMGYYQNAMNEIRSKYYMIFSDDIAWCRQNFKGDQFIFAEGNDEVTDLSLMLSCENQIIANSSFSWWAAYLNKNPSKIVIAPQRWFGPKLTHDTKDLCPPEWIRI